MIDKTAETEADNGYLLTVDDLEAWEAENGRVPGRRLGAAAHRLAVTRAGRDRIPERRRERTGDAGARRRGVAVARHTSGTCPGSASRRSGSTPAPRAAFDPPFPVHNFLLGAGRLGLTQLANLERLPITGALIVVSPLKLVGGTGSPSRVFAFVPKD